MTHLEESGSRELCSPLVLEPKDGADIKATAGLVSQVDMLAPSCKARTEYWWVVPLEVMTFITLWWTAAIVAVVKIKQTVSINGIFPHPFAFTSLVNFLTGLLAWFLSEVRYSRRPLRPPLARHEILYLLAIGMIQGMEIGLTNKALGYLSVAGRTMISSTNVLIMMATAWVWGLERLGCLRVFSAFLLISGGLLQGLDTRTTARTGRGPGVALQVVSMLLSAQRWALAQHVLQRSHRKSALGQVTKLQLLARTLPVTGFVCVPLAVVFEMDSFTFDQLFQGALAIQLFLVSAGLTAMLYAELMLVKRLSAVAFNVLATIHQIPIVLAGVVIQHNQVGILSAYGFALCLVGALVYAAARHSDPKP